MSQYTPPPPPVSFPQPAYHAGGPQHGTQPPAKARRSPLVLIVVGLVCGVLGLVFGIGIGLTIGKTNTTASTSTTSTASDEPVVQTQEPDPGQNDPPTVSASNYTATLKTLSKQCFGSAGCSVDIRVELGVDAVVRDVDAEVIVTITGDESGPITETMEVTGGQYDPAEVSLSTKSSKTPITVKVKSASAI